MRFPVIYIAFMLLVLSTYTLKAENEQRDSAEVSGKYIYEDAKRIRYKSPDSAIVLLELSYERFIDLGDTVQAINVLLEMADIYGNNANYAQSYDAFWKSLFLADDLESEEIKASVYISLGRMYSFYKREDEAMKYFQSSLEINKRLLANGFLEKAKLVHNYYALCATYRELNEPLIANAYLDSCFLFYAPVPGQVDRPDLAEAL